MEPASESAPTSTLEGRSGEIGITVAAAVLILLVGMIGTLSLRVSSEPPYAPPVESELIVTTDAPQPATVKAEAAVVPKPVLAHVNEGTTSIGGRFWLVEIRNDGTSPVGRPGAVVSMFDAEGDRLVEQRGWSPREYLAPGDQTTALVLVADPPAEATRSEVAVFGGVATANERSQLMMDVTGLHVRGTGSQTIVTGDIQNNTEHNVRFVRMTIIGRDKEGVPVTWAAGMPTDNDLAPGASSGFQVRAGTFVAEHPDTWEAWAIGRK